jgi:DNA-binding response OmpR family regulator
MHVLLAESNEADAAAVMEAVRRHDFRHIISWATDGAAALEVIFSCTQRRARCYAPRLDLVLLALKLPTIDGVEVLRRLKRRAGSSGIPVVMLITAPGQRDIVESYEVGTTGFLVKPVTAAAFAAAVAALARPGIGDRERDPP